MKFLKVLLASAAFTASLGANANVIGSLGGGVGTFGTLSGTGVVPNSGGLLTGAVNGVIVGGAVFAADLTFAHQVVPGETFLAAGPTPGTPSTLTFTTPLDYISFLWGSPETFNTLTVNSTVGDSQLFTATSLLFPVIGNQSFNQSVQFSGVAGSKITSLVFASFQNAFEAGRFTVTPSSTVAPIPEPETYALMIGSLGVMGFVLRRTKKVGSGSPC